MNNIETQKHKFVFGDRVVSMENDLSSGKVGTVLIAGDYDLGIEFDEPIVDEDGMRAGLDLGIGTNCKYGHGWWIHIGRAEPVGDDTCDQEALDFDFIFGGKK